MNKVQLEIEGNQIEVSFGYGTLRRLGELWGVNTLSAVFERLQVFGEGGEPTLDQMTLLGDIVSVSASNEGFEVSSDQAVDILLINPEKMVEIIKAFVSSLPNDKKKLNQAKVQSKGKK